MPFNARPATALCVQRNPRGAALPAPDCGRCDRVALAADTRARVGAVRV